MNNKVKSEVKRQAIKREQIVNLLKSRGFNGVLNYELSEISLRYGGHLGKLYELGYHISKKSMGEGVYLYTLISEPSPDRVAKKSAMDTLIEAVKNLGDVDAEALEEIMGNLGISARYKPYTHIQKSRA